MISLTHIDAFRFYAVKIVDILTINPLLQELEGLLVLSKHVFKFLLGYAILCCEMGFAGIKCCILDLGTSDERPYNTKAKIIN